MTQPAAAVPWRRDDAGVIVYFRLTPKSSKDAVNGLQITAEGLAFQARVRAIPEHGAANAALERLVSEWLGVPKRSVRLATGGKSRLKSVAISGDFATLDRMLLAKMAEHRSQKYLSQEDARACLKRRSSTARKSRATCAWQSRKKWRG